MAESSSNKGWIDVGREAAKKHPLYGVRGFLLAWIPLLAGLIVLSYFVQIFARPALDGLSPVVPPGLFGADGFFIPDVQTFAAIFLIIAIALKSRLVGYIAVLGFPLLTAGVGLYISVSGFLPPEAFVPLPPIVMSGIETGLEAAVVFALRDMPIMLYFTLSRRVMVSCYAQIRSTDPFLKERLPASKKRRAGRKAPAELETMSLAPRPEDDAVDTAWRAGHPQTNSNNATVHSDGIRRPEYFEERKPKKGPVVRDDSRRWAADEDSPDPAVQSNGGNAVGLDQTPAEDDAAEDRRHGHMAVFEDHRWEILEKYDADAAANFESLAELGSEWQAHYVERCVEAHPEARDAAQIAREIRAAHDRYWHLSDDPAINRCYKAAYAVSLEAAEAFKRMHAILGDKMNAHKVLKDLEAEFTVADKDLWGFSDAEDGEDAQEIYFVGEYGYRSLAKAIYGARARFAARCDTLPTHKKLACMRLMGKSGTRVSGAELAFSEGGKPRTVPLSSFGEFLLNEGNNNQIRQIRAEFLG